jgi:hypothetical protein
VWRGRSSSSHTIILSASAKRSLAFTFPGFYGLANAAIMDRRPTRLGGEDDEDDLPGMFATPAEEAEFWRNHTIDGRRCKPLEPVKIERPEPDLPAEDPFGWLSYEEWREGMRQCPALYLDPRTTLGMLMGRSWSPHSWG